MQTIIKTKKMSLELEVNEQIKVAMRAKERDVLESLRAIKNAILVAKSDVGATGEMTEADEIKLVQRLQKQRKEAAAIYTEQGREDLAEVELQQAAVIARFLPQQMSEAELTEALKEIVAKVGATGPQDLGKVMGMASKALAGKAEGKMIASTVKSLLQ
ncbi:MAG: hypothetical protein ACI8ZO_000018 [Flavobacteriales bacterium]